MPIYNNISKREVPVSKYAPGSVAETPEEYAGGIKPPPVTFEILEDLRRTCESIRAMSERAAGQSDAVALRRLARLVMIERELRQVVHDDVLAKRYAHSDSGLFPYMRQFDDVGLIVQDLQAVWNGEKWSGDGACTLNKWLTGTTPGGRYCYTATWPKRALFMHTSMAEYQLGERLVSGRHYLPSGQDLVFYDLKVGDYITGELYVEVC